MIVVATIRNTGTHLLLDMLGITPVRMHWTERERGVDGCRVAYGHIYPRLKDTFMPLIENNITIVPLRHPLLVAKSWFERGGNPDELVETWELLVNEIDQHDPIYLPIDSPHRVGYLNALNIRTGLNLKTDWQPVGSFKNNHALRHHNVKSLPIVHDLVDRISGFLERFY